MNKTIRAQFPILQNNLTPKPLVYLDNAATTQKPLNVIEAMDHFYLHDFANIHRGVYKLAERATVAYENVRANIAQFIHAKHAHEIIFVRGVTEAINLVAASYGGEFFKSGDEIVISTMEHHSNIVPWQLIAKKTGAKLKVININQNGEIDLDHYQQLLNQHTKMVAITHVSNTLGTINPVKKIIEIAHQYNIPVLVDGAQALSHLQVDVQELDCDFYTFSAHKAYGPTGVGVLYGKEKFLDIMPPYQGGGDMIKRVTFAESEFADLPQKFEAGTANIAGVVGLGAAIDFINSIGLGKIMNHEEQLLKYATDKMHKIDGLTIIGNAKAKIATISFVLQRTHPHDVATILDGEGVAVRAGNHCTMPLMDFYGISGTTRVSFGVYNTQAEVDILTSAINQVNKLFK